MIMYSMIVYVVLTLLVLASSTWGVQNQLLSLADLLIWFPLKPPGQHTCMGYPLDSKKILFT